MEFDITAMKQRAKGIIRETKPSPWILGIFFMVLTLFYEGAVMVLSSMAAISGKWAFLGFVAIELVFVLFRSSCRWYALKLAREESTALSFYGITGNLKAAERALFGINKAGS